MMLGFRRGCWHGDIVVVDGQSQVLEGGADELERRVIANGEDAAA